MSATVCQAPGEEGGRRRTAHPLVGPVWLKMANWCSALLLLMLGSRIGGTFGQTSSATSGLCEANSVSLVGVSPQLLHH